MTQPENSSPSSEMLTSTIEAARVAITNDANLRRAFREATRAAQTLRDAADDFAHLRASIVSQMAVDEGLSLSQVAGVIGVSKQRAGQLVDVARKMRTAGGPDHLVIGASEIND